MNAENFKQRYLPFHDKMYRLAFRYTGSWENAEDMVQETYLKLWKKRDELPEMFASIFFGEITKRCGRAPLPKTCR